MKPLIKKVVEAVGPSGYENGVRKVILTLITGQADDIQVDALGNLVARKGQKKEGGMRVMISAHMDEIGVIATHIDENGFIRFSNIGGVRPYNCVGGRVRFLDGTAGVIGMERLDTPDRIGSLEKMFIDVGAESRELCPVQVGDMAVFERPFQDFGNRVVSKAMDDRVSCAVLIELMQQIKDTPHELVCVFSTQEGGWTARRNHSRLRHRSGSRNFDRCNRHRRYAQGHENGSQAWEKGPAIKVRDGGMISDPRVVRAMVDAAKRAGLPYQLEILEGGTTDARAMQITRAGVPAGCVSIPCRYIHSPSEMVDIRDVEASVKLLVELLSKPVRL